MSMLDNCLPVSIILTAMHYSILGYCIVYILYSFVEKEIARLSQNLKEDKAENKRLEDFEKELHKVTEEAATFRMKVAEKELELEKARTENKALKKHGKV